MPSTAFKEQIPADEQERLATYAEQMRAIQRDTARGRPAARGLHAKAHAGVRAELEIFGDLPEQARHGIFAQPKTYRALARFSNGSNRHQSDKAPDVRGFAIKVLGVPGKKVIVGLEDATTQDFLAIQASSTPFRGPGEFVAFARAAQSPALLPVRLLFALGFSRTLAVIKRLAATARTPIATLAGIPFYSALPIRVGPYAARFAFQPMQATDAAPPAERTPNYLADDLAARLRAGPLRYEMKLQFFEDEAKTPIEDASVDWDAPYVRVGMLTLPQQDVTSPEGRALAANIEGLSFDPWHALVEHTPLGAMMRARKETYYASIRERGASPEPKE